MSQRITIGSSDLEIAPLALGTNVFGWTADRDASFEVLDAFVGGGGDCIDTADGYPHWAPGRSGGESEQIIGEWLATKAGSARDRVTIATKVSTHPQYQGLAASTVRAAADASLERLGVESIDLYYAHFDDADTPLEETVAVFSELVDQGKVRAIGVSNYTAERIEEWLRIARAGGFYLPVALQPLYNLVEREYERNGLRAIAEREGLGVFTYYSLAHGFLTGKYRAESDVSATDGSPRATSAGRYLNERGLAVLAALDEVAAAHDGASIVSVALAWLRQQPTVVAPIASARHIGQLPALLDSMALELTRGELEVLAAAGDASVAGSTPEAGDR